jgi:hypothetical protein
MTHRHSGTESMDHWPGQLNAVDESAVIDPVHVFVSPPHDNHQRVQAAGIRIILHCTPLGSRSFDVLASFFSDNCQLSLNGIRIRIKR